MVVGGMSSKGRKAGRSRILIVVLLLLAVILVAGGIVLFLMFEGERPQVSLVQGNTMLGMDGRVVVVAEDHRSGLRELRAAIVQNAKRVDVFSRVYPRQGWFSKSGPNRQEETISLSSQTLGFNDGSATLEVTAVDFSLAGFLQGNKVVMSYNVTFDTKPPVVSIVDSPRYIRSGGGGIVVYRVNESVVRHGVMVNDHFNAGFPLPQKGENTYGALIGIPFDLKKIDGSRVIAVDPAGNEGGRNFAMTLYLNPEKTDTITISDNFLDQVLPEFQDTIPELVDITDKIDQFVYVNSTVREQNYLKIVAITQQSSPEKLWQGVFHRLPRSSRRAGFAEVRSYYYLQKKIDQQVHLGVDLASVRRAEVHAANTGIVAWADYLGIYGNTVIIDHGMGLFSLSSHLSEILVKPQDNVTPESVIGLTGTTGMAGGDHLHFSLLINGVFVNPLEWWDKKWIEVNITNYL